VGKVGPLDEHELFLRSVYHTACKRGTGLEQQLQALMKIGCERFGMDIGVVADVQGDSCEIVAGYEPDSNIFPTGAVFTIADSICAKTMMSKGVVRIDSSDPVAMRGLNEPLDFLLYLGIAIRIDGQTFGTLCFFRQDLHGLPPKQINDDEVGVLMLIAAALIERKLHLDSEQQMRQVASIVDSSDDAIFTETLDRKVATWNHSAEVLYGYTDQEVLGQPVDLLYPDSEDQLIPPLIEKVHRGERTSAVEVVHRRKDGSTVNVAMNLSPIRAADGRIIAASVMARDIDDRKKAEQDLAQSEERYALASRGSNDGLWDWDLRTNTVYYSPRWKSILGYEEHEIEPTPESWTDLIDTSDATQFQADLAFHLAGQTEHLHSEHRVATKSGEQRWVLCRGVAVRDHQGEPVRIAGSLTDITRQKQSEAALLQLAQHDKLTGLPNRAMFVEIVRTALARSKRSDSYKFAVLFLDFDRFKVINDSLGHEFGDMLLINIAQQLRVQIRTVDTAARLGGDEFVVLLDGIDGIHGAIDVANRLLSVFSKPHNLRGHEVISTASIGIVTSEGEYHRPDELIRDADNAMYQAKAAGKARYVIFDEQMHAKALQRLNLEKDMRKAISLGQMWVAYQPIVDLEDGTLKGFEALLRWDHPELGAVGPDQFIVIAEETGEIVTIGDWVMEQACRQLVKWKQDYPHASDLFMNINVSKRQVAQPDVVKKLAQVIEDTGVNPSSIKLEITESAIMDDRNGITPVLDEIRSLGVQLAMDDFGTGHSSLSCLHRFPIDVLKIDREFIMNMEQRIEYTAVIQAIITLAHTLNISVVAEGLETVEQVAQLQALECDTAQGYYFSKPLTREDAGEYILNKNQPQRLSA
jgi:diguanylate cyclase (GGDEF)-like protein/PAS domain S-box-containing protein